MVISFVQNASSFLGGVSGSTWLPRTTICEKCGSKPNRYGFAHVRISGSRILEGDQRRDSENGDRGFNMMARPPKRKKVASFEDFEDFYTDDEVVSNGESVAFGPVGAAHEGKESLKVEEVDGVDGFVGIGDVDEVVGDDVVSDDDVGENGAFEFDYGDSFDDLSVDAGIDDIDNNVKSKVEKNVPEIAFEDGLGAQEDEFIFGDILEENPKGKKKRKKKVPDTANLMSEMDEADLKSFQQYQALGEDMGDLDVAEEELRKAAAKLQDSGILSIKPEDFSAVFTDKELADLDSDDEKEIVDLEKLDEKGVLVSDKDNGANYIDDEDSSLDDGKGIENSVDIDDKAESDDEAGINGSAELQQSEALFDDGEPETGDEEVSQSGEEEKTGEFDPNSMFFTQTKSGHGKIWLLNDDSHIVITGKGQKYSIDDFDEEGLEGTNYDPANFETDQIDSPIRRPAPLKVQERPRPVLTVPSKKLVKGSKEWIARRAFELIQNPDPRIMTRWTKRGVETPQAIADLYPKRSFTPIPRQTVTVDVPPPTEVVDEDDFFSENQDEEEIGDETHLIADREPDDLDDDDITFDDRSSKQKQKDENRMNALSRAVSFPYIYKFKIEGKGANFYESLVRDIEKVSGKKVSEKDMQSELLGRKTRITFSLKVLSAEHLNEIYDTFGKNHSITMIYG
eukprot:Plantae.Rhodophyta-Hildenbrandia_rubra.ctg2923.p2 GENE.Plantae.Rhodophyta-Hildenbrandia_rubra.ctg2923~~Plantae.Rhodophyta-Hildenbrandia_rubra.ctg2923.p2  ORF type:complete len:681 (+),score=180.39 Plantae.Rhodophyta-Hildenbrandia_rubra.ctg2923:3361-5403(+)